MSHERPAVSQSHRTAKIGCAIVLVLPWLGVAQNLQTVVPVSAGPASQNLIDDLVRAYHILAVEGIVDGYGHVSVRHDKNAKRYLLARSVPPAYVTASDIMEYDLDSNPVEGNNSLPVRERFIHGEIYKARPDVMAVVHSHSPAVIPFSVSSVPLRAIFIAAAFIGDGIPIFEIRDVERVTNMLVETPARGIGLARTLRDKPAVLIRGHGAAVVGPSIKLAVARSVYLDFNARLQEQAILLGGKVTYLEAEEALKTAPVDGYDRAWELWKRKVESK